MPSSSPTPRSRRLAALALTLATCGLGACAADAPTAPDAPPVAATAAVSPAASADPRPPAAALSDREAVLAALDDVRTRLLPALGGRAAASALGESLDGLVAGLGAGDAATSRRALADARRATALLHAANGAATAAELDAADLALDAAAALTHSR
jgi:hypothetical protein